MNRPRVRRSAWIAGIVAGLTTVGVGVLFLQSGLDASDKWASVFGVFLNVVGLMISVYSVTVARRTPVSVNPAPRHDEVHNVVSAAEIDRAVVQVRDVDGLTVYASARTSSPAPAPAPAQHTTPPARPDSTVSNHVIAGNVHGPVIQGRDIHGLSIHQSTATSTQRHGDDDAHGPSS